MAGLMGVWASSANAQPSPCTLGVDCNNQISIASAGPAAVGATVAVPVSVSAAGTPWAGYGAVIEFSDTIVSSSTSLADYTGLGGTTLDAAPTVVNDGGGVGLDWLKVGSARSSGTTSATGVAINLQLTCLASGVSSLRLVPPTVSINNSTTLGLGGTRITTDLNGNVIATITCEEQADVQTVKTGPATAVAGTPFDWVSTVHNAGPNAAVGVIIGDNLPENPPDPQPPDTASVPMKIFNSATLLYNGSPIPCVPGYLPLFVHPVTSIVYSNIVLCDLASAGQPIMAPSDTAVLTVNVTAPLYDAGKLNVNVTQAGSLITPDPDESNELDCTPLALPPGNLGCAYTQVLPALVSIAKVADAATYSEGDTITWTVTVSCGVGGSPCADATGATGPVVNDTVDANQTVTGATMVGGTCSNTATTATCTPNAPLAVGGSAVMVMTADVVGSANNECVNNASATYADPLTVSTSATAICLPPTVRMEKDLDTDATSIDDDSNLWLCEGPSCTGPGQGSLTIYELVSNVGNDPDGAGAYEFQIKFDHKIFDVNVEDASWLSNGGTRDVNCAYSVVTENWILWGCVSTGPTPGQTADGVAAIITLTPDPDLKYRMTPGNDNGLVSVILDENCEIADPLGHPLEIPGWDSDGIDNDGDTAIDEFQEALAPGVVTGGMIAVCSDMGVTVRILEGDLNLDCDVDVADEQAIAFRYGAFFGSLYYSSWYDLEPWIKDFDIDIKDLQKVFGRDGSTCEQPIPAQDAVPFPW